MESMEAIETNPAPLVKETPTDAPVTNARVVHEIVA